MRGDVGRCGEMWGDVGRSSEINGDRTWTHEELVRVLASLLEGCDGSFDLEVQIGLPLRDLALALGLPSPHLEHLAVLELCDLVHILVGRSREIEGDRMRSREMLDLCDLVHILVERLVLDRQAHQGPSRAIMGDRTWQRASTLISTF